MATSSKMDEVFQNKQNLLKKVSPGFEIRKKITRYYFKNIAGMKSTHYRSKWKFQ